MRTVLSRAVLAPVTALLLAATLAPTHASTTDAMPAPQPARAYDTIGVTTANGYQSLTPAQAKADAHRLIKNLDVDIIGWQEAQKNLSVYRTQLPRGWQTATFTRNGKAVALELPISWDNRVYALVKGTNRAYLAHRGMGKGKTKYPFPNRWTTRVVLKHRVSKKTVTVLNVHANQKIQRHDKGHCGEAMRTDNAVYARKHFAQVKRLVARQTSTHTVVTGDFNVDYTCDQRVKPSGFPAATYPGALTSSYRALGRPAKGTHGPRHIDYVWVSAADANRDVKFISQSVYTNLASDHNALNVRLRLL